MKNAGVMQPFKLAAIDLDGTLLGPDREISPENARAVQRLQEAGLQIVLASGRHYHNMHRYADSLPSVQWMVSCQGGESSNSARDVVLNRDFLSPAESEAMLKLGTSHGFSAVVYTVDQIFTLTAWNSNLQLYGEISGRRPQPITAQALSQHPVFKIIWMGTSAEIEQFSKQTLVMPDIQMIRTHERLLEIMPANVTKASGLRWITTRLGVPPTATMTFGDGDNDVPMFDWSGASFAMAHGWPAALQRATHVTPAGPPETAFARGVDLAYEMGLLSDRNENMESRAGIAPASAVLQTAA